MYCGIDNGLQGAIVFRKNDIRIYPMPVLEKIINKSKRHVYDYKTIYEIFITELFYDEPCNCVLEEAQVFGIEGKVTTFTIGKNFGFMEGLLLGLKVETQIVPPKEWQKFFGISGKKGDTKIQAEMVVNQKFPEVKTRTKGGRLLDGICDALLMSEYAKQIMR